MRFPTSIAATAILFVLSGSLIAGYPDLEYRGLLKDGTAVLTVQMQAIPCAVDWDNDGRKDLVVGEYSGGNIRVYLNGGTDGSPEFSGFFEVLSGGAPIAVTYG